MWKYFNHAQNVPGAAPGIEHEEIADLPRGAGQVHIRCIDYCPEQVLVQEIHDLEAFLARHRPEWTAVRWINVDGLSDTRAIQVLATKYDLHPLAIEDMLQKTQRPKVEAYGSEGGEGSEFTARLFIVAHDIQHRDGRLQHEQMSIFLGHKTVLTFQANPTKEWDSIRQRLEAKGSRLRNNDASFLAYSLLDAIVDSFFPILEVCSERAEELESLILGNPQPDFIGQIHQFKRDLLLLRWVVWPMREVVTFLQREHECVSETTRIYLRDLYDHVVHIIDLIETDREIASDLISIYMSAISNRMNEVMKTLTLISTIFIPLTFLAGVYGMNFHYLPELGLTWAYPAFWVVCLIIAGLMTWMFRHRHWL
ncbi:MAG: magnesium/cobalt transporter CorA [Candidatus Competibacteraceae bacterium]|nr:magnesium/cobalt transporter CorA [Candidatus Competibacteraceae bacterium]